MSDFRIRIQAELDAKNLTSQINALKQNKIKIPVELDLKNTDLQKALSGLTGKSSKIKVDTDTSGVQKAKSDVEGLKVSVSQLKNFQVKIDTKGALADVKTIDAQIKKLKSQISDGGDETKLSAVTDAYKKLVNIQEQLQTKRANGSALDASDLDAYNTALKETQNQIKILKADLSDTVSATSRIKLTSDIQSWLNNNTNATKEAKSELQDYIAQLNAAGNTLTKGQFNEIQNGFKQTTSIMKAQGNVGKSWADDFKRAFGQIAQFAGAYGIIQNVMMDVPRQMWSAVRDVDDAMTSLQMATGVSNTQAKELMSTYAQLGDQLKATSTDVAASGTEWLKQGQSIANSNKLAQSSIILSKIGDLSSEEATSTITAAMKSYDLGVDEVMSFVDKISAIDMASATDVGGLATAFNEVAANARNAGVEVDKLLSYAAVIGETTQESMASVGTSLNAIFSRMGNIKLSRLKDPETGEDLSNTETSLRNVGIELRESTGEFRDFDEVLDEVASKWDTYSEVTQRSIASSMAGTHHMNEIMVLMQNYSDVQKYMSEAANSSGTSMQKYEAYTQSLEGRIQGFTNSFQTMSSTFLNTNLFGGLIDGGTQFLNILTQILDVGGGIPAMLGLFTTVMGAKGHGKQEVIVFNALSYKVA